MVVSDYDYRKPLKVYTKFCNPVMHFAEKTALERLITKM